ncbi:three-Cys-motif partner protein TcmP [Microbacterium sp. NEAU-LLC]|uniref:Three-Cys-motif partner protein TcmP n=1 Tax=Microbacterium helvum TaxID=2773713 RepID=A0ABR8NTL4_9MICO|nr:three-Cys-motif partner protein TcmP [Microbacterium helvum]MBD3943962.1 three-Cys-motif partner protein TcmP [Microbacterium helvum]
MTANEKFFAENKKAAAVLKHGVLKRYLAKFAGATASTAPGRRVGFLDGYAGEGAYTNPRTGVVSEGSPAIALRIANDELRANVELHCRFIERDEKAFTALQRVLAAANNPQAVALHGDVRDHLDSALESFGGMPALVFIDPFGSGPDIESTVEKILKRGGDMPTELLLNFSIQAVRRMGPRLWEKPNAPGREMTLARMDEWLGGDWWREVFDAPDLQGIPKEERAHTAALRVASEYRLRVCRAAGCLAYTVPIHRKPADKEPFWLILFFPRRVAMWYFNEAVSLALGDWRKFLADVELDAADRIDQDQPGIVSQLSLVQAVIDADEAQIQADAIKDIKRAITSALSTRTSLSTRTDFALVFGAALGVGRETHLRKAWKELAGEGVVVAPPTGSLANATIRRSA